MRVPIVLPTSIDVCAEKAIVDNEWMAIVCTGGMVHFWGKEPSDVATPRTSWTPYALYVPATYASWDFVQFCDLKLYQVYGASSERVLIAVRDQHVCLIIPEDGRCIEQQRIPSKVRDAIGVVDHRFLCVGDKSEIRWFDIWGNLTKPWESVIVSTLQSGEVTRIATGHLLCVLTSEHQVAVFKEGRCLFMHSVEQVANVLITLSIAVCQTSTTLELVSEEHRQSIPKEEYAWLDVRPVTKVSVGAASSATARRNTHAAGDSQDPEGQRSDLIAACSSAHTVIFMITRTTYSVVQRIPHTRGPIIDVGWISWVEVVRNSVCVLPDRWSTGPLDRVLTADMRFDCALIYKHTNYCTLYKETVTIQSIHTGRQVEFTLPHCHLLAVPHGVLVAGSRRGEVWHWDTYKLQPKIALPSELPILSIVAAESSGATICALQHMGICCVLNLPRLVLQFLIEPSWLQLPLHFAYSDERLYARGGKDQLCYVWNDDKTLISKNARWPLPDDTTSHEKWPISKSTSLTVVHLPLPAQIEQIPPEKAPDSPKISDRMRTSGPSHGWMPPGPTPAAASGSSPAQDSVKSSPSGYSVRPTAASPVLVRNDGDNSPPHGERKAPTEVRTGQHVGGTKRRLSRSLSRRRPRPRREKLKSDLVCLTMPFFIASIGADESINIGIRRPWSSYGMTQWALLHLQSLNSRRVNLELAVRTLVDGVEPYRSHAKATILKYFVSLPFATSFRHSLRPWVLRLQMVNDKQSLFVLAFAFDANTSLIKNPRDFKALGSKLSAGLQVLIFEEENEYWQRLAADVFSRAFPNLLPAITSDEKNSIGDLLLKCFGKYQAYKRERGQYMLDIMILIGGVDPLTYVQVMAKASRRLDLGENGSYSASSLSVIASLVRHKPDRCSPILTIIVETVLRCLEPSDPNARKTLLIPATQALHQIVQVLPMATFHQETQRFAVGTAMGPVHVYDLRTATKWRILEGHQCKVLAVAFAADGEKIASYAVDGAAMMWQISSSGILGFLGVAGKLVKCHSLEPILENRIRVPRLRWTPAGLQLVRENGVQVTLPM